MPSPRFTVAYALTAKKTKSFMQPKLEAHARSKGITFVALDRSRALTEQGPYDVILHKSTAKEWRQELEDYVQKFPEVIILDPPAAIQQLRNRQSMLKEVADLKLTHADGQVRVPSQTVVVGDSSCIPTSVAETGLKLPLIAKPLVADGSAKSHAMSLIYDQFGLSCLDTPLVLQEFVNHGAVLFKVYVIGDGIKVVRRFSLPDLSEKDMGFGVKSFPRVSCAAATANEADLDPEAAVLPPQRLLECLVAELRTRLNLSLFNFDMIREGGSGSRYYVIDINYFPGFGKVPDYELLFTDYLVDLAKRKGKKLGSEEPDLQFEECPSAA